jgi:hypothetical protein
MPHPGIKTAMKRDSKFRLKNARTYLFDYVQIARNAIYKSGATIAGAAAVNHFATDLLHVFELDALD